MTPTRPHAPSRAEPGPRTTKVVRPPRDRSVSSQEVADDRATSRITIRDVAAAAGVSTATVSRALRGLDLVEPRTRDHVVAVARQLKYSVWLPASRLATGHTGIVGIVTPSVGRWYFTEVFAGVHEQLRNHDVELLIHSAEETGESIFGSAAARLRRRVDGALVVGMAPSRQDLADLKSIDVPIVLLGAQVAELPSVSIDDRAAARTAVQHLVERGHQRIGLITGYPVPTAALTQTARLRGYLDVLAQHSLPSPPELRVPGWFTAEGGQAAMRQFLDLLELPTAVFVMSDEMAYGAMRALARAGLRAGGDRTAGDIAIVGFDGHDLAGAFDLTTVHQPVRALAQAAADLLLARMGAGCRDGVSVVMPTRLQIRGSTGHAVRD